MPASFHNFIREKEGDPTSGMKQGVCGLGEVMARQIKNKTDRRVGIFPGDDLICDWLG